MSRRWFLLPVSILAEVLTVSAGLALIDQFDTSISHSWGWGATAPGGERRYALSAAFYYEAESASLLFFLLVLAVFRSPFRFLLCCLLAGCHVMALGYTIDSLELQHWSVHYQGPSHWKAHAVMSASLGLHQLAFIGACLLCWSRPDRQNGRCNLPAEGCGRHTPPETSQ